MGEITLRYLPLIPAMQDIRFTDAVGTALLALLDETPHSSRVLLMDARAHSLHHDRVSDIPYLHINLVPNGEENKILSTVQDQYLFLHNLGIDRRAVIIAAGGGLALDLVGFAAATWKRGLRYVSVPTTLLAMVDASIGGKTGVNFLGAKNQVGCFHPPVATVVDTAFLSTLPERELLSGFAEVLKHGLVADAAYWEQCAHTAVEAQDWAAVVRRSIEIKTQIVAQDPHETNGAREVLNYGHTFGHALESLSHFQHHPLSHGEAVALGMVAEAWLSVEFAGLPSSDAVAIQRTLHALPYPWDFHVSDRDRFTDFLLQDKKNRAGTLRFALLNQTGAATPGIEVPLEAVLGVAEGLMSVAV